MPAVRPRLRVAQASGTCRSSFLQGGALGPRTDSLTACSAPIVPGLCEAACRAEARAAGCVPPVPGEWWLQGEPGDLRPP